MFSSNKTKDNYLGVCLNLSPQTAIKLIGKTINALPYQTEITLPNIGMTIPVDRVAPNTHYVQLGFHGNYQSFTKAVDNKFSQDFLLSTPFYRPDVGGITRRFGIIDSLGNKHKVWAIICIKSHSPVFDKYILAHEEGHVAMIFGYEQELLDAFIQKYPGVNRKLIEDESNEFKAILAGLLPFVKGTDEFAELTQAMDSFNLQMDKDHQKALYLTTISGPNLL